MQSNIGIESAPHVDAALWDRRLHDIGWGLLLMLTGGIWLMPPDTVPPGTWLFGVAIILLGVNAVRYAKHIGVSGFSFVLGVAALIAAVSQMWRTDPLLSQSA
jgi:hypothetical protein